MKGQWIGKATGGNSGVIIINIDDRGIYYSGVGYFLSDRKDMPSATAYFRTENKNNESTFKINLQPIDPNTGFADSWENVKKNYPNVSFSNEASVKLFVNENELCVKIVSGLGIEVQSTIIKKPLNAKSEIIGEDKSWDDYKNMVYSLCGKNNLFRGQRKPWRLKTLFHRKRRYDISRFLNEDRLQLHRVVSAKTSHFLILKYHWKMGLS